MSDVAEFIHLRVRSPYSLLRGAMRFADTIKLCLKYDMPAVAITDQDNLFGSLEFSEYAKKQGIQPIIGATLSLKPLGEPTQTHQRIVPDELLVIAKDEVGYANIMALSSLSYTAPIDDQSPILSYEQLAQHSEGLIVLTAGIYGGLGKALLNKRSVDAAKLLEWLKQTFGNRLYIELMRHGLESEKAIEADMLALASEHGLPVVATNHVYFAHATMFEAHDALMCVGGGHYVSEDERPRVNREHYFKTPKEMQLLFADIPQAIQNTVHIARRCSVFSPSRAPILPSFQSEDEQGNALTESEALQKLARDGLQQRLAKHVLTDTMSEAEREAKTKLYSDRLEFELDVIITMKFPGYFLIVSDFIVWAKKQGIPVGPGRGSGAGSLVAWVLQITDLDPIRFGLIFERFLNPERVSMPDFDIDFCQERRDEVISYVQQKYGADRVAQIITFGKLQARAVLRDAGRVLQMPYSQIDRICKLVPNNPAAPVTLEQAIGMEPEIRRMMESEEAVDHLVKISLQLEGLYRHASTHAAGVVIADRPLHELVPVYRDPKSDMLVVQYSMKYAESAGLVKFDFLGLKTLTVIQKTLELISQRGIEIDISKIGFEDAATYALLSRGDTVGVFQFESAGMQDALRKLKPDCLEDLIALGALYRPGPMDNIPTYIARKHGKEAPDYLHPLLEDVLKETYGVIIYQEQVQKIAQILAGYTLGSADLLRRAMGKKIKEEMDAQRETFVSGAKANGVDARQASSIFDLVAKFAGYGFNKSHAAAYAVIAYHTAYLKANFPVEFIAASMTYDIHSTDKLGSYRQEASRMNIALLPPDINRSHALFSVEKQADNLAIRYALSAVKNVGAQAMESIVKTRESSGAFKSVFDLAQRVDGEAMNRRQLEHLVMAGAFDNLHPNRRALMESIDTIMGVNQNATRDRHSQQNSLFGDVLDSVQHHALKKVDDWKPVERLQHEFAAIGFYLSAHPLSDYEELLARSGVISLDALSAKLKSSYGAVKIAGIVTARKNRVSNKGKFAFVQLSDATGQIEFSVFDESLLNASHDLLQTGSLILVRGEGKSEESGVRVIAQEILPLDSIQNQAKNITLQVHINDAKALPELKEKLGSSSDKGAGLQLVVHVSGHRVQIKIPQRYTITQSTAQDIAALDGITKTAWL